MARRRGGGTQTNLALAAVSLAGVHAPGRGGSRSDGGGPAAREHARPRPPGAAGAHCGTDRCCRRSEGSDHPKGTDRLADHLLLKPRRDGTVLAERRTARTPLLGATTPARDHDRTLPVCRGSIATRRRLLGLTAISGRSRTGPVSRSLRTHDECAAFPILRRPADRGEVRRVGDGQSGAASPAPDAPWYRSGCARPPHGDGFG